MVFTSRSEYLEKLYRVFPWAEDPSAAEGLKRYRDTLSELEAVAKHKWFEELLKRKRELRIVDLCSGTGIGGVALAKLLTGLGASVSLTLVDLRQDALAKAEEFCARELGFKPRTVVHDILEVAELGRHDIAIMWGHTTPHFSPWDWVKVLSNTSRLLAGDGLFLYDEADRVHAIFYLIGYRDLLPERVEKDRVVLTVHRDRDFKTGYTTRLVVNLLTGETEELRVYYWDLASSAAFVWVFFADVDFISTRAPYRGVVVARSPRRTLNLETSFKEKPLILFRE